MNYDIIKKYLTVVGRSFYNSNDFETYIKYQDYKPTIIGKFGIGIFSFFLISDEFLIKTRFRVRNPQVEAKWLETRFTRTFCPTYEIKKPKRSFEYGTMVKIKLKPKIAKRWTKELVQKEIRKIFIRPRIPLFFGWKERIKIKTFPYPTESFPYNDPAIIQNENETYIFAQEKEKPFIGFHSFSTYKGKSYEEINAHPSICTNGIHIKTLDPHFFAKKRIFFFKTISSFITNFLLKKKALKVIKLNIIIDLPPEKVGLTLNRDNIKNLIKNEFFDFQDLKVLTNYLIIKSLKENYIKKLNSFWDWFYKIDQNVSTFNVFLENHGIEDGVNCYKLVKVNELFPKEKSDLYETLINKSYLKKKRISSINNCKEVSLFMTFLNILISSNIAKIKKRKSFAYLFFKRGPRFSGITRIFNIFKRENVDILERESNLWVPLPENISEFTFKYVFPELKRKEWKFKLIDDDEIKFIKKNLILEKIKMKYEDYLPLLNLFLDFIIPLHNNPKIQNILKVFKSRS